ncbi:hypothetical protein BCM14_0850 [Jezberella montanilacus]|jgi:predicted GNAT family acetyltransferase|uniref:N-acetyltransferase domain-containing protein n=1 Tax=Jezberella montanilacus TaxID=323426 RepID=A0A2T0XKF4_9BURK|nr:GNAT family N-acetyltransferase [Jezberella montanilacus]PRY99405.1 hypothetical protein BCM14_0850 [Jezberella montanilacus]
MNQDISHDRLNSRFTTLVDGHACVLTYTLNGRTASFDHTGVPDAVGGRGIAAALTKFSLDTARDEGWQVIPRCSYVEIYIRRHPEYADLVLGQN